jgi:hypothetical protein
MLGFDEGENLFLTDTEGHDGYRPLNLQRMPFYARGGDLAIDLDHPRVSAAQGQPIFTEDGQPTRYLRNIMTTFSELKHGTETTKRFIDTLLQHKLIEPVELDLEFDDGSGLQVSGLYTVSQDALRELADGVVVELFRRGYLRLIYMMIASIKQVPVLAQRKNDRLVTTGIKRARG